jgi:hypothetical protein
MFDALKYIQKEKRNRIEKLWPLKIEGVKLLKNKTLIPTKADS